MYRVFMLILFITFLGVGDARDFVIWLDFVKCGWQRSWTAIVYITDSKGVKSSLSSLHCGTRLIMYETKITSTSTNKQHKNVYKKTPSIYPDSRINKRYCRVNFISLLLLCCFVLTLMLYCGSFNLVLPSDCCVPPMSNTKEQPSTES